MKAVCSKRFIEIAKPRFDVSLALDIYRKAVNIFVGVPEVRFRPEFAEFIQPSALQDRS
jgi:hypothetical protein